MSQKVLKFLLTSLALSNFVNAQNSSNLIKQSENFENPNKFENFHLLHNQRENFSLLIDFTCATAKDELEKHPEMRTIALIELENNFPAEFSREVMKCLPSDVAKVNINPHQNDFYKPGKFKIRYHPSYSFSANTSFSLPKETMIIYFADKMEKAEKFFITSFTFRRFTPTVSHLSKSLVLSSRGRLIKLNPRKGFAKAVQIYEENQKIIAKSFDTIKSLTTSKENFSQILFPDGKPNFLKRPLYVGFVYKTGFDSDLQGYTEERKNPIYKQAGRPNNKWMPLMDILDEKLNATLIYKHIVPHTENHDILYRNLMNDIKRLIKEEKVDFVLNNMDQFGDLQSYSWVHVCFLAPKPQNYSIVEQILVLPLDNSCWMWLSITIATSTLIWRILEGHWNFFFGAFAYFVGQSAEIRTTRFILKTLLQILIITLWIFSNGYQSIVTSFMLEPIRSDLLKTVEQVFESDLNVEDVPFVTSVWGGNPSYLKAKKEGRVIRKLEFNFMDHWFDVYYKKHTIKPENCESMTRLIDYYFFGKFFGSLYLVPDIVSTRKFNLYTPPFHPYLETFQHYMDISFEAGLHQAWVEFYYEIFYTNYYPKAYPNFHRKQPEEEKVNLEFEHIVWFFLILAVGFVAATLALFCEIFYQDFMMQLTKEYFKRKFNEMFGRKKKKVKKVKVRKVQVKPMEESGSN